MNTTLLHAEVEFLPQTLRKPLQLSTGMISEITEARVSVQVRVTGREAIGRGSIYLSDLWSWPDPALTHEHRDGVLRTLCGHMARVLPQETGEPAHPLELGLRLHERLADHAAAGFENVPLLARAMCLSPFDAAIHDAVGQALQISAFEFYNQPAAIPGADALFPGQGAIAAVKRLLCRPQMHCPAWLLVGKNDDLDREIAPWVRERGYSCFKMHVLGDNRHDAARAAEVYRKARAWGVCAPRLSVDSNEANADAASVMDFLTRLRDLDAEAFDALAYLEQPTRRDIRRHRNDWRQVGALKPVFLDEGLTSFSVLPEALAQGWSGLALKTCKGHSFALVAAAWARQHGMLLALQDLTNVGFAAIHSALFAAFVPTINGMELNSPQFTPDANAPWLPRLAGLLDPKDGTHRLPDRVPVGLGSGL